MGLGPFIKTRAPKSLLNRGLSPSPTPRQGVSPTIMGHQIGGQTSSEVCTGGGGDVGLFRRSRFRHLGTLVSALGTSLIAIEQLLYYTM